MVPCWIGKVTGKRKAVGEIQPDVFDVKLFNNNLFKPKVELTFERTSSFQNDLWTGFRGSKGQHSGHASKSVYEPVAFV